MINPRLRGRALTSIRPGIVIKSVLAGQIPLHGTQYATEASISDLHNAYKDLDCTPEAGHIGLGELGESYSIIHL